MPPKRRTSMPGAAARNQQAQSTLSFHKQGPNRITKPGAKDRSTKKKDPALLDIAVADVNVDNSVSELDLEQPTTAEAAIAEQTVSVEAELATQKHASVKTGDVLGGRAETSGDEAVVSDVTAAPLSNEETKAMKISDAQIKKYWQSKERERKAPRVHQEGLTIREKLLREWDMSGQYGPCIGIARLKRWKRANILGLNPPYEVLAVLLREIEDGNTKAQRAHVDELMSSRFIET